MRVRSILGFFLMVTVLVVGLGSSAWSANAWYECEVIRAGTYGPSTAVWIMLTDKAATPAFRLLNFQARAGREKEQLAIALTAMSSGLRVRVWVDLTAPYPVPILVMYLANSPL